MKKTRQARILGAMPGSVAPDENSLAMSANNTNARAYADGLLAWAKSHPVVDHAFLRRFSTAKLTRTQLLAFASQQYLYSRLFARNLAAVISNVPDECARTLLIENMYEEVGEPSRIRDRIHLLLLEAGLIRPDQLTDALRQAVVSLDRDPVRVLIDQGHVTREQVFAVYQNNSNDAKQWTHPALFRRFLAALGLSPDDMESVVPLAETQQLIDTYGDVCRNSHWLSALGAMGPGTECVVAHMYTYLLEGINRSELVSPNDYVFWTIHVHCDDGHGQNIINALIPHMGDKSNQDLTKQGAGRVLEARHQWYDALIGHVFR